MVMNFNRTNSKQLSCPLGITVHLMKGRHSRIHCVQYFAMCNILIAECAEVAIQAFLTSLEKQGDQGILDPSSLDLRFVITEVKLPNLIWQNDKFFFKMRYRKSPSLVCTRVFFQNLHWNSILASEAQVKHLESRELAMHSLLWNFNEPSSSDCNSYSGYSLVEYNSVQQSCCDWKWSRLIRNPVYHC